MIKRRFFKQDHGDRSGSSDTSSSSESSSSREPEEEEEEEAVEEDVLEDEEEDGEEALAQQKANYGPRSTSPGSGYESEDSSGNDIDGDSSDVLLNEEDGSGRGGKNIKVSHPIYEVDTKEIEGMDLNVEDEAPDPNDPLYTDLCNYIMKCKSAFKCRICPRIVCLSDKTVREHLKSKRHARCKKLLGEGRLKLMLNSDGELEEEQETHAERHARTIAVSQAVDDAKRKDKGRQRQRRKKKLHGISDKGKTEQPLENVAKRRRKNID